MWRDILLVIGFVFTALGYLGLTPKRLAGYAETAKVDIGKKNPRQKRYLFAAVALTPPYIFFAVWSSKELGLWYSLWLISIIVLLWGGTIRRVWKLSEGWTKVRRGITYGGVYSLLLAADILSDMPLWEKFALPLIGIGIAYGMRALRTYMYRRHQNEHASGTTEKDSTL